MLNFYLVQNLIAENNLPFSPTLELSKLNGRKCLASELQTQYIYYYETKPNKRHHLSSWSVQML